MTEHRDTPHWPGTLTGCPACEEAMEEAEQIVRSERFMKALLRVRKAGTYAARRELQEARHDLEAHGETAPEDADQRSDDAKERARRYRAEHAARKAQAERMAAEARKRYQEEIRSYHRSR